MELKHDKVIGYVLLAAGIVMILLSVYFMFNVFTGATAPPGLFNFSDINIPIPGGETVQMIPGEEMNRLLAMFFWYLLMFFIMIAGGKIASLGISLIKEVKVELKK